MFGSISSRIGELKTAMNLRVQRQQLIASNIANADTPNYKARDFDFSQAFSEATVALGGGANAALVRTNSQHFSGLASSAFGQGKALYRKEKQSAVDGNTVDMDTERAALSENSMQYEVLVKLMSERFSGMRAAIGSNQG